MLILKISKNKKSPEIEVFLDYTDELRQLSEVEVSVSFYPYQRKIKADHYRFDPYQDYVADLTEGQRSTYQAKNSVAPQGFGLFLGGTIFGYFSLFYPQLLISIESLVSIFAAYTVGKEIWSDLDTFLQDVTSSWRLRWVQQNFYYVLQQFGTFQRFWQRARYQRYGYQLTLPDEIDLISHSNSKTIEMLFKKTSLQKITAQQVRVLRISFEHSAPSIALPLQGLIICRVAKTKKVFGIRFVSEYFQAYDAGKIGSLDLSDVWHDGKSLQKNWVVFGRAVVFIQPPILRETLILRAVTL